MKVYGIIVLLFFSLVSYAEESSEQRQETQLRIQPVGKVRIQHPLATENKTGVAAANKEPGQATYEQYCIVCHKDGLAGAPKFKNEQDWKPRLANRMLKDLVASSIKGLNAMPAKGTCIKCSEDDLRAAITYMLPKS